MEITLHLKLVGMQLCECCLILQPLYGLFAFPAHNVRADEGLLADLPGWCARGSRQKDSFCVFAPHGLPCSERSILATCKAALRTMVVWSARHT